MVIHLKTIHQKLQRGEYLETRILDTSIQELTNLSNLSCTAKTTFLALRTGFDQLYTMLSAEFGTLQYENDNNDNFTC